MRVCWNEIQFKAKQSYSDFSEGFKVIVELLEKPSILASAFTLLAGLYTQSFGNNCTNCYFPKFNELEIAFLWPVSIYLILDASSATVKNFNDIFYLPTTPTPAKAEEPAKEVVADPTTK